MKKSYLTVLSLACLILCSSIAEAGLFSCFKKKAKPAAAAATCAAPVAECTSCASSYTAPESPCMTYVDQVVTAYKMEQKTRKVEVTVYESKMVEKIEDVTYNVVTPVTEVKKVPVVRHENVFVDQPYDYYECVPTTTIQKQNVTEYVTSYVDEAYTYNVCVPVVTPTIVSKTMCKPVTEQVVSHKCVTKEVCTPVCDPCTGCVTYKKSLVSVMEPVCSTVTKMVNYTVQHTVNVTSYTNQVQTGTRKVCKVSPVVKTIDVSVVSYAQVKKTGSRKVCQVVAKTDMVDVTYCSYKTTTKTDKVKKVYCETFPVKKMIDEVYCENVAYQTTVKVAVPAPAACAPAAPACAPTAGCASDCAPTAGAVSCCH